MVHVFRLAADARSWGRAAFMLVLPGLLLTPSQSVAQVPILSVGASQAGDLFGGYFSRRPVDFNGDGAPDLVVGSVGASSYSGRVDVFFLGPAQDSVRDVVLTGESLGLNFGRSLSGGVDVNGDGYQDLLVGGTSSSSQTTKAFLFYGGPSVDDVPDLVFVGPDLGDGFGSAVVLLNDFTGDGEPDVAVGAPLHDFGRGAVYVYAGGPSLDAVEDVVIQGLSAGDEFGAFVDSEDFNGDGMTDLVVVSQTTGTYPVFFGGASQVPIPDVELLMPSVAASDRRSATGAGDLNGDGFGDIVTTSDGYCGVFFGGPDADGVADLEIGLPLRGAAGLGDVNGDGHGDLAVAFPGGSPQPPSDSDGRARIYFGGPGFDADPDWIVYGPANEQFGWAAAPIGDVTNDGLDDFVVGAPQYTPPFQGGRSYLFAGELRQPVRVLETTFGDLKSTFGGNN